MSWWNGSAYEQLTRIADDGAISAHASPVFTDELNALVGVGGDR